MLSNSARRLYLWVTLLVHAVFGLIILLLKIQSIPDYFDEEHDTCSYPPPHQKRINYYYGRVEPAWLSTSQAQITHNGNIAISALIPWSQGY